MTGIRAALQNLPPDHLGYLLLDRDTKVIESSGSVSASLAATVLAEAQRAAWTSSGAQLDDSMDKDDFAGATGSGRDAPAAGGKILDHTIAVPCTNK